MLLGLRVEVAVVGTALPVLLSISPSPVFHFGQCAVDEQIEALCTVNNESASLPLSFVLHRVAHFQTQPKLGNVKAENSMDVLISFQPNQIGQFKPVLHLDVLGSVVEDFSLDGDPTASKYVYTVTILATLCNRVVCQDGKKLSMTIVMSKAKISHFQQ